MVNMKNILFSHSCYPSIVDKVISCLSSSGHYECCLRKSVAIEIIKSGLIFTVGIEFRILKDFK